jgi:hypothetical protein
MPKDAPVNVGAEPEQAIGPHRRVSEIGTCQGSEASGS